MTPRARSLVGVGIMSALLVLYFVFVGVRAVALLSSGSMLAVVMGIALVILPLIGAWALVRELQFGARATALVDRLAAEDALPEGLRSAETGRPDRAAADAAFPQVRAETEAHPESWREWARLGLVYDACGDRRRARGALRTAIRLAGD